eukprot:g3083.t1
MLGRSLLSVLLLHALVVGPSANADADADGEPRRFTALSASDQTHIFMYSTDPGDASSPSLGGKWAPPEEGDLIVIARFAPMVWMVDSVEHSNAVSLTTLDGSAHGLYSEDEQGYWGSANPGYWVPFAEEEDVERARQLKGGEGVLLAEKKREAQRAQEKAVRDAQWEAERHEQIRRHASIVGDSAERQREQQEEHRRAERERERAHEETAPSWLSDKPFMQLSIAGPRDMYMYVKGTDERPGLGSLITLSVDWSADDAAASPPSSADGTSAAEQDETTVWLVQTIEHDTAVSLRLVSARRHGLPGDFDSSRGGVWEYYDPPEGELPPYMPTNHPLLNIDAEPAEPADAGAGVERGPEQTLACSVKTGEQHALLYMRVHVSASAVPELADTVLFPDGLGFSQRSASADHQIWRVISVHDTSFERPDTRMLTLQIVSHAGHGFGSNRDSGARDVSWHKVETDPSTEPYWNADPTPGNTKIGRVQLSQFYDEVKMPRVPWQVDDVLHIFSNAQMLDGLAKKFGRYPVVGSPCLYPLFVTQQRLASSRDRVLPDLPEAGRTALEEAGEGATVSEEQLKEFYEKFEPSKAQQVSEAIDVFTTSQLVEGLIKKYRAAPWPGADCKYEIANGNIVPDAAHEAGADAPRGCRFPIIVDGRDCAGVDDCASQIHEHHSNIGLTVEQLAEFYKHHNDDEVHVIAEVLAEYTTMERGNCVRSCASNKLKDAKRLLSEAIHVAGDGDRYRLLYKRYAVLLRQRKYVDAVADLTKALKIRQVRLRHSRTPNE